MVIDLTNVDLNLYAGLSLDDQGYVQINGLQLDADFNDANLQLEHLNLDGDLSESISRVISRYRVSHKYLNDFSKMGVASK